MDNEHEHEGASPIHNGRAPEENWGAQNSLRRNAGMRRKKLTDNDEGAPLLGNGNGNDSGISGSDETGSIEWEGLADFDGLPWWRRPSVSLSFLPSGLH